MSIEITSTEEKAIIALALDEPLFFGALIEDIGPDFFKLDEAQYVFKVIKWCYDKDGEIPSRELTKSLVEASLDTGRDEWREILDLCDYRINPRDYKLVKDRFIKWLRSRTLDEVYQERIIEAAKSGDYTELEKIVDRAAKVQEVSSNFMWFFDDINKLFDEQSEVKYTTGFPALDQYINEGGPTKGDVLVWMAPTGVGKSLVMCNNAAACVRRGLNVLHITCELSEYKTACRYLGIFTKFNIKNRFEENTQKQMRRTIEKSKKSYGDLNIIEFPPDMITIRTISSVVDDLKKKYGWTPDVIVIDYLELLLADNRYFNKEEYDRQKRVSTEVRQLAKTTNTFIITATQTNRAKGGEDKELLDVNRVSESYGKAMPADYIISINQNRNEYGTHTVESKKDKPKEIESEELEELDGLDDLDELEELESNKEDKHEIEWRAMRLYIAKNRNGPKFKTVNAVVNFNTMIVQETTEKEKK